jgi:heat shock protein HslJ
MVKPMKVNWMNTWRDMRLFISLMVAGIVMVLVITPAVAFPLAGNGFSIEGAAGIPARSDAVREFSSGALAGTGVPVVALGTYGVLPESYLNKDAAGYGGAEPAGSSAKETLIDALAGRISTPTDSGGGLTRLISGEGTIRFIGGVGGYAWVITTPDGNYLPDNLPAAMKVDGTRVRFEGVVRASASNDQGGATPLSLITVSLPAEGFSSTGTVRFIALEGGFFGIITPAGDTYLPLNLPDDFKVDGLQVVFTAREAPEAVTTGQWGTPIRIDSIARSGQQAGSFEGSWNLAAINGKPLIPGTAITASFGNGRVSGSTGCNQYFASYSTSGLSLMIGEVGSTRMYCSYPEGITEQETLFFRLLSNTTSWSTVGGDLVLNDESGKEILVFTSALAYEPSQLIEFSRTGGFAGFDDHLVLSSDGSGTVTRKETVRSIQVPGPVMRKLTAHLIGADFVSLDDRYPATAGGADLFTYSLTYRGKTVVTEDTGTPAVLVPIIITLSEIIESSAPDDVIPRFF